MTQATEIDRDSPPSFLPRIIVALLQAVLVYVLLDRAGAAPAWPATQPALFEPLLLIAIYLAPLVLLGLGNLPGRGLATWAVLAALILAFIGWHDAARGRYLFPEPATHWPWLRLWFVLTPALFIANILATDTILERRPMPSYARHFDTAWKQGAQIMFAACFVGLFWGVLHLGASLFALIQIEFLKKLIDHLWFACPATTLAIAAALHVTDVQPALLRGARSLALTLFSWLLPLLALLAGGFLVSLPFVSLETLWHTHFATSLLLTAQALLIFFLNCWYQDGPTEHQTLAPKRIAAIAALVELPLLTALSVWGLSLRVTQHGWTEERILAAALIAVAGCYAIGYAVSLPALGERLPRLEKTNFAAAYLMLALVLALFTPIADPARLMVADQLARLKSGTTPADQFDFAALKFDGAKWGLAALEDLSRTQTSSDASTVNDKASKALAQTNRFTQIQVSDKDFSAHLRVWPIGHAIPSELDAAMTHSVDMMSKSGCVREQPSRCVLRFMKLGTEEREVALLFSNISGRLFIQDGNGAWKAAAQLQGNLTCAHTRDALAGEEIETEPHPWPDLIIAGQRFNLQPDWTKCP